MSVVCVNDKWQIPWREGMTVQDTLDACGFTHAHIVVSVDNQVIPPDQWATWTLPEDAEVKAIHVIAGG